MFELRRPVGQVANSTGPIRTERRDLSNRSEPQSVGDPEL